MASKLKICIATGTRADWGILSPLAAALKARADVEVQIMATNMHLMSKFGSTADEIVRAGFTIDETVEMAAAGNDTPYDKAVAMGQCLQGAAGALRRLAPDAIVILGDRFEMLAVASAAAVMLIPIVHISGGETTGGAVDDSFRHAISQLASLHLVSAEPYRKRVVNMGANVDNVVNTGSLGVWNMMNLPVMSRGELCQDIGIDPKRPFVVATFHPATLDTEATPAARCAAMFDALERFPRLQIVVTYPNNDAGSNEIISEIERRAAARPDSIKVIKSLGLKRYMSAIRYAEFVIGNSSSGIIEVPSTGTPVVNIGMRQQGRLRSDAVIDCGNGSEEIEDAIVKALSPDHKVIARNSSNPYYSADTLRLSVESIVEFVNKNSATSQSAGVSRSTDRSRGIT